MTEEEKQKNFLERNRQAALKCRQRKKAWLAQLQAKVEFLENENERLTTALVSSRAEISRLSAVIGASGISSTVGLSSVSGGAVTGVPSGGGQGGAAPISINVSLPGPVPTKTVAAPVGGGGRGYGF